jgi:hypothetical protein
MRFDDGIPTHEAGIVQRECECVGCKRQLFGGTTTKQNTNHLSSLPVAVSVLTRFFSWICSIPQGKSYSNCQGGCYNR